MIIMPSPNTYVGFKSTHELLVTKHDDTVVYIKLQDFDSVTRVASVFSNTSPIRLDVQGINETVATILLDFPNAIQVFSISTGD